MRLPLSSSAAPSRWVAVVVVALATLVLGAVATTAAPLRAGPTPAAPAVLAAGLPAPPASELAPAAAEIPAEVLATYRAAALRHDLPWPVLAALGRAATDHGRRSPVDDVVRTTTWPRPDPAIEGAGGVGPLLIDPAAFPDVDPVRLQSWPVAVELVATRLDEALDAVVDRHASTRAELAAAGDLAVVAPLYAEALAAVPVAATGGVCEPRPQETGGELVRALWRCGLAAAEVHVVGADGVLVGAPARALLTTEAMDLAWRWSRWGSLPCDADAPAAGVFPVPASAGIDRCDPVANVGWVAATVRAAELVPVAERTDPAGGWQAVVTALLDPSWPAAVERITPAGLLPDPEPMGALPSPDTRFDRRVVEHAARYAGGTLPVDGDVVSAAQAAGATRGVSWRALATWRTVRLHHPTCTVGLGPVLTLALGATTLPVGWEVGARDGDGDGVVDLTDRDDHLAAAAAGLCGATDGWRDLPSRTLVAGALTGDLVPTEGTPATVALALAAAVDEATAPTLVAARLPDPAIGPRHTPAPRPDLPVGEPVVEREPTAPVPPPVGAPAPVDLPAVPEPQEVEAPVAGPPLALPPVADPDAKPDAESPAVPPVPTAPPVPVEPGPPVPATAPAPHVHDEPVAPAEEQPEAPEEVDALTAALARVAEVVSPVELRSVRGIRVAAHVAPALEAMLAAAQADGVVLTGGGYRSTASQVHLRAAHCGTSAYDIWERRSAECSPPTATPGASRHETGEAVDFVRCSTRSTACYQWLAANAAGYGFWNQPAEAWHWSIDGR